MNGEWLGGGDKRQALEQRQSKKARVGWKNDVVRLPFVLCSPRTPTVRARVGSSVDVEIIIQPASQQPASQPTASQQPADEGARPLVLVGFGLWFWSESGPKCQSLSTHVRL